MHLTAPLNTPSGAVTVNEAGLTTGSGELADGLAGNNSDPSETAAGTLAGTVTGGTGPYTFELISPADGTFGTLTLNPDGSFSFTLDTRFDTTPDANNGAETVNGVESFQYRVTDSAGSEGIGTININIVDDVPTANADTNSVGEGAVVNGNVLTDGTDDVFGADGQSGRCGGGRPRGGRRHDDGGDDRDGRADRRLVRHPDAERERHLQL